MKKILFCHEKEKQLKKIIRNKIYDPQCLEHRIYRKYYIYMYYIY